MHVNAFNTSPKTTKAATTRKARIAPRQQIPENPLRPQRPTVRRASGPRLSKVLCCLCSEPKRGGKSLGEELAESRRARTEADRLDPPRQTKNTRSSPGHGSTIGYHRDGYVSRAGSELSSGSEAFQDARECFSEDGGVGEKAGILKRCVCAECRGAMEELGRKETFRSFDLCRWRGGRGAVRMREEVRVATYDAVRGGVVREWVEVLNTDGVTERRGREGLRSGFGGDVLIDGFGGWEGEEGEPEPRTVRLPGRG